MKRRQFVKSSLITGTAVFSTNKLGYSKAQNKGNSIKLSLNTYSFNKQLRANETDLFELIEFCKHTGFDAIDPTGYYFPGYPSVPEDEYIYEFKRRAFLSGLEISGTGIRNDFANISGEKLMEDLQLIEAWCKVASKLGAPLLRVFPGKELTDSRGKAVVMKQVIAELKKACSISEKYGVMLALQNHNDFLKSSEEIEEILVGVNSQWLGLHLDIGSLAFRDPYDEIRALVKYAITWQIKEKVWENGEKVNVDYDKLMDIILTSDYVGYLPLETLNADPVKNLPKMVSEVRKRIN